MKQQGRKERRFKISAKDYIEFQRKVLAIERADLDAKRAAQEHAARVTAANAAAMEAFAALGAKYGFDPKATYRFDDAGCAFVLKTDAPK